MVKFADPEQDEVTCENEKMVGPEDPVVDSDHDDDRAPEGHEGGEEGIGEVGVEDTEPRCVVNRRCARPRKLLSIIHGHCMNRRSPKELSDIIK